MMNQYNFQWCCARCGNFHNWWRDSIDLKSISFKCVSCSYVNQVKYKLFKSEEQVKCDVVPYRFSSMPVDKFVNTLPQKPTLKHLENVINEKFSEDNITPEEALNVWCVHDALHYITGIGFNVEGEQKIRYLEEKLNIGWYAVDPKFNTNLPKRFNDPPITSQRLREVASQIKEILTQ